MLLIATCAKRIPKWANQKRVSEYFFTFAFLHTNLLYSSWLTATFGFLIHENTVKALVNGSFALIVAEYALTKLVSFVNMVWIFVVNVSVNTLMILALSRYSSLNADPLTEL